MTFVKDPLNATEPREIIEYSQDLENRIDGGFEEVIEQLAQTDISVYQINKNKGLIDETYLSDELKQQMVGNTPIHSVPARDSVTLDRTAFYKRSSNIHDKLREKEDVYINVSDGEDIESTTFRASDFRPIKGNMDYYVRVARHVVFFSDDNSESYISGYAPTSAERQHHVFTSPSNAKYVRYSWSKADITEPQQLNEGTERLPYEEYFEIIDKKYVEKHPIESDDLPEIPIEKMEFVQQNTNLFNKESVVHNARIDANTGNLITDNGWVASDFIPIDELSPITVKHLRQYGIYDEGKVRIQGGSQTGQLTIQPVANAKYLRFSWYLTNDYPLVNFDTQQVNKGNSLLPYEPFGYKISNEFVDSQSDEFILFLPNEINVAVGRTIELYNNQVAWCGNIDNYHFKWDCDIGNPMKRKFSIKGEENIIGEHNLALTVYDNNMGVVAYEETTVRVVSDLVSEEIELLTIGDSLTNGKAWLAELSNLSNGNIVNVGTRGGTHKHEGRSGFFAKQYLEPTEYTFEGEGVHPFWDGSRFNWNHYKTSTEVNPDAVQLFLGTNNIALDPTENANAIKQIVDYIRQDDATIPIYVVFTLYRGNQDGLGVQTSSDGYARNKGAWKLEEDRKVFNLMVRLHDLLKDYTNLEFVPISLTHDSEFNFGAVETPVNPRASQTELLPTEATHPQTQGYMQMADIMFSVLCAYNN